MTDEIVAESEFIIRRIPPSSMMDTVKKLGDGGYRPTSATLGLRPGEKGLSCSRRCVTSPEQLLSQIGKDESDGWMVAAWQVSELPAGLEVILTPSDPPELDPGHCEIRPVSGNAFKSSLSSKLAKKGRIIFPEAES